VNNNNFRSDIIYYYYLLSFKFRPHRTLQAKGENGNFFSRVARTTVRHARRLHTIHCSYRYRVGLLYISFIIFLYFCQVSSFVIFMLWQQVFPCITIDIWIFESIGDFIIIYPHTILSQVLLPYSMHISPHKTT
jgi:hypothetical protein